VMDDLVPDVAHLASLVAARLTLRGRSGTTRCNSHAVGVFVAGAPCCSSVRPTARIGFVPIRIDGPLGSINAQHLAIATRPQLVCDHVTQLIEVSSPS